MNELPLALSFPFSFLSFITTLIIIYLFCCSRKYDHFEFRLVLYMQIFDCIYAFSYIIVAFAPNDMANRTPLCEIHAFLANSSSLSSLFFSIAISTVLISRLQFRNYKSEKYEIHLLIFSISLPIMINILWISLDLIGPAGCWCFIKEDLPNNKKELWRVFSFYIFMWIGMAYNTTISLYFIIFFKDPNLHQEVEKLLKQRVILIPLVMSIYWIIPTIYRTSGMDDNYGLSLFYSVFAGCNGFFNSCVYATTPGTMRLFLKKFCRINEGDPPSPNINSPILVY